MIHGSIDQTPRALPSAPRICRITALCELRLRLWTGFSEKQSCPGLVWAHFPEAGGFTRSTTKSLVDEVPCERRARTMAWK